MRVFTKEHVTYWAPLDASGPTGNKFVKKIKFHKFLSVPVSSEGTEVATKRHSRGDSIVSGGGLLCELVQAGLTDFDETFGGDIWHCQERISLKPAQSVEILMVRRLKKWF